MPTRHKQNPNKHIHLPLLVPPKELVEDQWHRAASDIINIPGKYEEEEEEEEPTEERMVWGSQVEFLMSCIATSVGLGNVWRFAFVAYQNGGGAFLIPYLVVLLFIGRPMYYLECVLGQFSSRNSVRVWSCVPSMIGTGYAQTLCILYILSYYVAITAICLHYLVNSFRSPLPWSACDPSWTECVPSDPSIKHTVPEDAKSSAELYFIKTVLQQIAGIDSGLGAPIWYLVVCLLVCWIIIFLIVAQGVKSSGKASYFLALFPYVIMIILLITTIMLPGSSKGIVFFITPQWEKLLQLDVWYAAVTQVFFSLTVGTGPIIMFSSYNSFTSNVHRDSMIITSLDTFTSLLSGFTIFGILGNLAHEMKTEIENVVGSGGTGLAFISYPDAIAKTFMPQVYAVLFFLMMTVLGVGSSVSFLSTINAVFLDAFTKVPVIYITTVNCILGFLSGIVYVTPGGQYILELVDYYGATFLALFCAICEIVGIVWIYGLENICLDLEYMLGQKPSIYWRLCWGLITPVLMITVFIYALFNFQALVFGGYYTYPVLATVAGYLLLFAGILLVPIFILIHIYQQKAEKCFEKFKNSFKAKTTWGPRSRKERGGWSEFKSDALEHQHSFNASKLKHLYLSLSGGYRKDLEPGQGGLEEPSQGKQTVLKKAVSQTSAKNLRRSMAMATESPGPVVPASSSRPPRTPQYGPSPSGSPENSPSRASQAPRPSPSPGSPLPPGSQPGSPGPGSPPAPGSPPGPGSPSTPGSPSGPGSPSAPGSPSVPGSPSAPGSPPPPDAPPPPPPPPPPSQQ